MDTSVHYPKPHPRGSFRRPCAHCHVEWPCPTADLHAARSGEHEQSEQTKHEELDETKHEEIVETT